MVVKDDGALDEHMRSSPSKGRHEKPSPDREKKLVIKTDSRHGPSRPSRARHDVSNPSACPVYHHRLLPFGPSERALVLNTSGRSVSPEPQPQPISTLSASITQRYSIRLHVASSEGKLDCARILGGRRSRSADWVAKRALPRDPARLPC